MTYQELLNKALEVRDLYSEKEQSKYGRKWTREERVQGLVGDIGDLMKIVMAKKGIRDIADIDKKLAHELSDCLWAILVIANEYGVDLEKEFGKTMNELGKRVKD